MGGVIVDVRRDRAIHSFQAIGVGDADKLIDTCHHKGVFIDFENGTIDTDEFCRLLCRHTGKSISREAIEKAWKTIIDPPQACKLEYIQELRKTYRVFLLTNNNPILIDWACTPGFVSNGKALSDYFDKLYLSYEMKCTKPDLKIYRMMIEDAKINPAESLFIDDSNLNLQAAAECNFQVLLAKNGADWRNELSIILNG
jgi:putative hydrolase of the HAD superfamily